MSIQEVICPSFWHLGKSKFVFQFFGNMFLEFDMSNLDANQRCRPGAHQINK